MKEILLGRKLADKAFSFIKSQGMNGWTFTKHGDVGIDYYRDGKSMAVTFTRNHLLIEYSSYMNKVGIVPVDDSNLYTELFTKCDLILDDLIAKNKPKTEEQLKQEEIERLKQQLSELESN